MTTLFVNAAFRDGSRTQRLTECYLEGVEGEIVEVDLGSRRFPSFDAATLATYNSAVAAHEFSDPMFDAAKQFAQADEVVIAAPFWNYGIPAVLHDYLENVCVQGLTFDLDPTGVYFGMCRARRLVYITTSGGPIPQPDCGFGYVASLARDFWHIPEAVCYKAAGIDIWGCDVESELERVCEQIRADRTTMAHRISKGDLAAEK